MTHFPHTRTYNRFPFHIPLIVGGESGVCEGTLRNLSMHGCSMVCDHEFPLGSSVRVSLLLPDQTAALPIDVGRIIWAHGRKCGVQIVQLPLPARMRLNHALRIALIRFLNARKNREWQKSAEFTVTDPF